MGLSRSTVQSMVSESAALLANLAAYLPDLYAALDDKQPGYPGGGLGSESEPATGPERLAIMHLGAGGADQARPDRAMSDEAQLRELAKRARSTVLLLDDICQRWLRTTLEKPVAGRDNWCANHLEIKHCVPRGQNKGDLCTWCANFKNANGYLPPVELLDMHDRCIRITMAHVELYRPAKPAKETKEQKRARKLADKAAAKEAQMSPDELAAKRAAEQATVEAQAAGERSTKRADRLTDITKRIVGVA